MKCYEENTEYVIRNVVRNAKSLDLIFIYIAVPSVILYLLLPDLFFLSGLFLFMAVFNVLLFIGFRLYSIISIKNWMNYSFVTKICFWDDCIKLIFKSSNEIKISLNSIYYLKLPKINIGEICYSVKIGNKLRLKKLYLSADLFYIIKSQLIKHYKEKNKTPSFIIVSPEDRAAMRWVLTSIQTYVTQGKKEKLNKILDEFWSKHKLEEFE